MSTNSAAFVTIDPDGLSVGRKRLICKKVVKQMEFIRAFAII